MDSEALQSSKGTETSEEDNEAITADIEELEKHAQREAVLLGSSPFQQVSINNVPQSEVTSLFMILQVKCQSCALSTHFTSYPLLAFNTPCLNSRRLSPSFWNRLYSLPKSERG